MVLDSIHGESRNLYSWPDDPILLGRPDYSYVNPAIRQRGGALQPRTPSINPANIRSPMDGPTSLYTILARQVSDYTKSRGSGISFTRQEIALLQRKGYAETDVRSWVQSLVAPNSLDAAATFDYSCCRTPLFVILLFLRRKTIRTFAFGRVLRYLSVMLHTEPISWSQLTVLIIRLERHARIVWPETMPWIASLLCTEATRMVQESKEFASTSSKFHAALTRFCNSLLALLSLETAEHPMLFGPHQEEAQFAVLQFMASCEPALVVTRHGFKGAIRTQLAHAKTAKEREWASLKRLSWPPWKEDRNAMDENKGYMFGASRASRLLHRLFEAGYASRHWEEVAEIYAGWDTDLSPTVQTRVQLRSDWQNNSLRAQSERLWEARIRTTRTRREAWACFLAYEQERVGTSSVVYQAMFEKLHYPEMTDGPPGHGDAESSGTIGSNQKNPLPGDTREPRSDPASPLHLVYISEPVPSIMQLYERMRYNLLLPRKRLLAFLLETIPDFDACAQLLEATQDKFSGAVRRLLRGVPLSERDSTVIPNYFLASFIRFLCRFGEFGDSHPNGSDYISPVYHEERFKHDRAYLIEYAHHLITHLRPQYHPPWTAYMQKLVYGFSKRKSAVIQYTVMCDLLDRMAEIEVGPDDAQFKILCDVTRYTARTAYKGRLSRELANDLLASARPRLRTAFHDLVGANLDARFMPPSDLDMKPIPPHAPGPDVLHAYVRALGFLRDYEGLYSFSIWLTTYPEKITARAHAQHRGPQLLYNTLVALRAGLTGRLDSSQVHDGAPEEIVELVKAQINNVEGWTWPSEEHVDSYTGCD